MVSDGAVPDCSGFLFAFFALVSTHGLHVSVGCWIVIMLCQIGVFGLDDRVKTNLLRLGLTCRATSSGSGLKSIRPAVLMDAVAADLLQA